MHASPTLWLCLGLPALPLEALGGSGHEHQACVITTGGHDSRVLLGNRAAYALGIAPDLSIGAAQALGEIRVYARSAASEEAALKALAACCGQFTSWVSLAPPEGLLLEVGKSLNLFGGIEALLDRIRRGVQALGYAPCLALAPTPLAALFFVRAGQEVAITESQGSRALLSRLPLTVLQIEGSTAKALSGCGLRNLGDLLRLPRAGLARRFGPHLVSVLDRALGRAADPRPAFEPPARFERFFEFAHEVEDAEALQFAAQRLLLELTGLLRARAAGTRRLDWILSHRDRRESRFSLALVTASRDPEHLGQLMRVRLERMALPEPVRLLGLVVDTLEPLAATTHALWPEAKQALQEHASALIERLRARLGPEAVCGLSLVPDHRPEAAWRFCMPGEVSPVVPLKRRPLWLLSAPQPLEIHEGQPYRGGILEFLDRSERIESGWWDGRAIARDYFTARNPGGSRFWVFREIEGERRWFVHGIFE
ncbi:MAG: Y-family DNA polymerase [Gammaproteobacteria bacterium]